MTLKQHAIYTGLPVLLLLPVGSLGTLTLFACGSMLIDVDHYFLFVFREKRLGIREMFRYHDFLFSRKDEIPYSGICLFHSLEIFALIAFFACFLPVLLWLLGGMVYHLLLDLLHLYRHNYLSGRALSVIEHLIRARKHRRLGYPYLQGAWRAESRKRAGQG
jgi:hypothetical protein